MTGEVRVNLEIMSSTDSGISSEEDPPEAGGGGAAPALRGDLNMQPAEPPSQEQEKTLTDHLNKRLLESFLNRLDTGGVELPPGAQHRTEENEESWEDS